MNCLEFRQLKLSEPEREEAAASEHRQQCLACARFEKDLSNLDSLVDQALSVPVPENLAARILLSRALKPRPRPAPLLWLGLAASFVAMVFIAYQQYQPLAISGPLLAHIEHKPHDFYGAAHTAIDNEQLRSVLRSFNAEAEIDNVVYAAICPIDGEEAAHLVIKEGEDQYTVMLLPQYSPAKTFQVADGNWRGYINPHPGGAMAVIADVGQTHAIERLKAINEQYQNKIYLTQR